MNGHVYLMNLIHLPFYLQSHGLPRMYTASEQSQLRKWRNAAKESKQKVSVELWYCTIGSVSMERYLVNNVIRTRLVMINPAEFSVGVVASLKLLGVVISLSIATL